MEVYVDPELCISCGACIDICPAVYCWGEDGKARSQFELIPPGFEAGAREGMESCPVEAISEVFTSDQTQAAGQPERLASSTRSPDQTP